MESSEKRTQEGNVRSSEDPRERVQQNPVLKEEELEQKASRGDSNDLLNEDPDEERREIEKSSKDK